MSAEMQTFAGQPSFLLETESMSAAVTEAGGMIAPVVYFRDAQSFVPYSVSPWAEEVIDDDTPPIVACLRGDFMCSCFGGNDELFNGTQLPVHGDTANDPWECLAIEHGAAGAALHLGMEMAVRGGHCEKHVALAAGQNVIYQRHDFTGVDGPINPGHHATLRFPDAPGSGRLAFSKPAYAHTFVEPMEDPEEQGYSILKPDMPISDLANVPRIDGAMADLTSYPARRGFEDLVILCADESLDIAWSSVTFHEEGAVWFTLRNPKVLPSTVLWHSNGGRHYAPWNGRHLNVMGVEDMTGFFHLGLAASARENLLNQKGIRTCHTLKPEDTLSVPYIQGAARVPQGFDRVASIEVVDDDTIRLTAESGVSQSVPCRADFTKTGVLPGLIA